ncbi:MAG: glycosyltransferase [Spirochaetia bacterium]|nr:glycosyltransferase [Spirochaetia bacterium]MDY5886636.1 glycosyltransferase [Treponema sp.]
MKVCILMSTYNGEKYIEEQLKSIFEQTIWNDCVLIIRDDGSIDNTKQILNKYSSNKKISIIFGENLGYAGSFAKLLEIAPDADYYCYSDQDDYWYPNKLERGISFLEKEDKNIPLMYFADCDYTDKNLNITGKRILDYENFSFEKSLFDCWALGFTQIINKKLRNMQIQASNRVIHDHFSEILSIAFGKQIHDIWSCAKYRRHENTVTTSRNQVLKNKIVLLKKVFTKNGLKNSKEFSALNDIYGLMLPEKQRNMIYSLSKDKRQIKDTIRLTFYKGRFKNKLSKEILLRFLFLINKI